MNANAHRLLIAVLLFAMIVAACSYSHPGALPAGAPRPIRTWEDEIGDHSKRMLDEGKQIFRFDTFGSEAFWGGKLGLHKAIAGENNGGVGPGLSPRRALQLGLKVDAAAVSKDVAYGIQSGKVSLDDPANTLVLLRANAVIGVMGDFDKQGALQSVGLTCALCHSTVDDSFTKGIGQRLDGWPNRDLDVGQVAALSPNLKPFTDVLGVHEETVKEVLHSWGPGRYDALLNIDGQAFRPDGKPAGTMIPAAFGLAGVNLHTYTGFGSMTYWNAYVANTQMYGQGTFYDPRLANPMHYPVAARMGFNNIRGGLVPESAVGGSGGVVLLDKVSAKLGSLQYYQLALPAPKAPEGSYDSAMAVRGERVFSSKARCATCHVPPTFTEPGYQMHTAREIGIDDFQAKRSPEGKYRTTPLRGLFTRAKGGFYHDGRFADYQAVINHYQRVLALGLTDGEQKDLAEYLKSL